MSNVEYWNKRTQKYMHTGWADPTIYCFDQKIRLRLIKNMVRSIKNRKRLLDFGCGDGDFARELSGVEGIDSIVGYDISNNVIKKAKKKNLFTKNCFFTNKKDIVWSKKYNVIICITVLQHILDDSELEIVLKDLTRCLDKHGKLIILEDVFEKEEREDEYTKYRTIEHFEKILEQSGVNICEKKGFYHPILCPTDDYEFYKNDFWVRLCKGLFNRGMIRFPYFIMKFLHRERLYISDDCSKYVHEPVFEDNSIIYVCSFIKS